VQGDAAEVVSVSEGTKEAVAHLNFQRGSVHKVIARAGKAEASL
jgi:hypothetical protein